VTPPLKLFTFNLIAWDSYLPMGIHHCLKIVSVGETYLLTTRHKIWDLRRPEVILITCTNLQLQATAVWRQSRLLPNSIVPFSLLNVWETLCAFFQVLNIMHAKVANSNPTNYKCLRSAINTISIRHTKMSKFPKFLNRVEMRISRHTVACCVAQEAGTPHPWVINRNNMQ